MDDNKNTNNNEPNEPQATPKMFTQAEKDKEIAMIINREREKFKDYETIQKEHQALLAEKKERELANKSEVEKYQTLHSEAITELTNVKTELTTYKQKVLRNDVLSSGKYAALPRAYKNMVKLSDNQEEIQASAEEALAEFQKDTGKTVSDNFGTVEVKNTTINKTANGKPIDTPEGLAAQLRNVIASKIKTSGRG